jgi:hypothetical protein
MFALSIPCFLLFQNLWHVADVDEKFERLELRLKTPQRPVNCQPYCSPPQKKSQYSTDTISGSLHVVRGRYEASRIRSDRRRAIEEDSAAEDIAVVKVAAHNDTRKKRNNVLHKMTMDMPSGVNRWSTPNKEDRRCGSASPPAIEKLRTVPDDKLLS